MLHRDGSIIHIDFGFFLTNVPGKGVELEKKCPFKLLTAYV
jgi:phosphatidylinositol 4-kinase